MRYLTRASFGVFIWHALKRVWRICVLYPITKVGTRHFLPIFVHDEIQINMKIIILRKYYLYFLFLLQQQPGHTFSSKLCLVANFKIVQGEYPAQHLIHNDSQSYNMCHEICMQILGTARVNYSRISLSWIPRYAADLGQTASKYWTLLM